MIRPFFMIFFASLSQHKTPFALYMLQYDFLSFFHYAHNLQLPRRELFHGILNSPTFSLPPLHKRSKRSIRRGRLIHLAKEEGQVKIISIINQILILIRNFSSFIHPFRRYNSNGIMKLLLLITYPFCDLKFNFEFKSDKIENFGHSQI